MYMGERPFWPGFPTRAGQSSQFALNLTEPLNGALECDWARMPSFSSLLHYASSLLVSGPLNFG